MAVLAVRAGPWRFVVPDEPIAKARPRVAVRAGRPHAYTPTRTARAEWRIREAISRSVGPCWSPLIGPVRLTVTAYVPQPRGIANRDRLTARPYRRPDLDNLVKTALDGCSILWRDDAQVVELVASKRYAVDTSPRWDIVVEEL